uniref:Oleosin 14.9 kDa-like n=1 Tax=Nicotiana sylvestris TaxID=4096 RepID=A0A1U7X897_NICSY|nr:PREDICTED: oleosin 14.9 kDa-like [Nicotiana sylvestris]
MLQKSLLHHAWIEHAPFLRFDYITLIFFTPLILVSSPIWFPIGTLLFIAVSGFLSVFGFGASTFAAISWAYRYFKRSRIADTASHMKD